MFAPPTAIYTHGPGLSSFREDLNVIFYQNMPNLHNQYKSYFFVFVYYTFKNKLSMYIAHTVPRCYPLYP